MNADSTSESLLSDLERLLEKKLKPIEVKMSMIAQKQESITHEQEKVIPSLQKIQRLVDDVIDQQDTSSRKIKDEIYNIQVGRSISRIFHFFARISISCE